MRALTRRDLLQGAAVGAVVVGWDRTGRSWATASEPRGNLHSVPPLDGVLLTDPASRSLAADDYGHIVHWEPSAVLRPLSVDDIVKMVNYARENDIKVSMRGQGHTAYGQSQVGQSQAGAGIVIDSATLNRIHSIGSDRASVDSGVLWRTLVLAAVAQGKTPPVLTDYLDLSVGGTLSIGGVGGGPAPYGTQVDNVLELDVVTGEGDVVTCSPNRKPRLFDSVLAGLGQCAIIVRATVRLIPAPTSALMVRLHYSDLRKNLEDIARLVRANRFSSFDQLCLHVNDRWTYEFGGAAYFNPPDIPKTEELLPDGMQDDARVITTVPYLTWLFRYDGLVAASRSGYVTRSKTGRAALFNGTLPEETSFDFLKKNIFSKTDKELGTSRVIMVPFRRPKPIKPLLSLPTSDVLFPFFFGRAPSDDRQLQDYLVKNRELYDLQVKAGGKRYPWDAIPFSQDDWKGHYGHSWGFLAASKRAYDPANILGPGPGIFP